MDSFLGLFDPGEESQLPPEPQLGNVEYKLKLVNPSKLRFEHLVTQVHITHTLKTHFTTDLYTKYFYLGLHLITYSLHSLHIQ